MIGRRSFLRSAVLPLASLPAGAGQAPRRPRLNLERLLVVEGSDVARMLETALHALPELDAAVRGRRVAVKPNATGFQPYPVTTDVPLLRALLAALIRRGAREVLVCDAPSYAGVTAWRVFSRLGYFALAEPPRVQVLCADPVRGSQYVRVSRTGWRRNRFVLANRLVVESDLVISLAIPKRHHLAGFSCALKNNVGCIADTFRTLAHAAGGAAFQEALVEFADAVRPDLTIVDARQMLARSGPAFTPGVSTIRGANRLVVASDMVAVDSFCAELLRAADPTFVPEQSAAVQLAYARELGLGEAARPTAHLST